MAWARRTRRPAGLKTIDALRAQPVTREVPIVLATDAVEEVQPLVNTSGQLDCRS